ncbi:NADPH dehydrogenase NamA [Marinicrinis lubricantis]|uniref:NADPH dehydrogenase n=1 Tax=Marinicrinis lubricantis TaxID=2086470 RepID=A0ABW1ILA9_9BACL
MSSLFSPITIGPMTLKNRIVMSPMCMYSAEAQDGKVTDWHLVHYTTRAVGQVGLIVVEATAVVPEGRISPQDLGIWEDDQLEGLTELTRQAHLYGAKIGIQLAHAGRKANLEGTIYAPSAIPFNEKSKTPKEMTKEDIQHVISSFRSAALRAKKAGFDCIEIHAAHGYLINEFLSPLSNQRTDEYGGTAEGRYLLLKQVIDEVRSVWDGALFVRISASDYHPDGLTAEDYVQYAQSMKQQGVDLIDCSSGAVVPASIHTYPGYQVPFAERIRHTGIMTGAVGLITEPAHAEEIVQNGRADLVFIARELLRDPYWPRTAAKQLGVPLQGPKQYERGW